MLGVELGELQQRRRCRHQASPVGVERHQRNAIELQVHRVRFNPVAVAVLLKRPHEPRLVDLDLVNQPRPELPVILLALERHTQLRELPCGIRTPSQHALGVDLDDVRTNAGFALVFERQHAFSDWTLDQRMREAVLQSIAEPLAREHLQGPALAVDVWHNLGADPLRNVVVDRQGLGERSTDQRLHRLCERRVKRRHHQARVVVRLLLEQSLR
jgi:hypothetical protein